MQHALIGWPAASYLARLGIAEIADLLVSTKTFICTCKTGYRMEIVIEWFALPFHMHRNWPVCVMWRMNKPGKIVS